MAAGVCNISKGPAFSTVGAERVSSVYTANVFHGSENIMTVLCH